MTVNGIRRPDRRGPTAVATMSTLWREVAATGGDGDEWVPRLFRRLTGILPVTTAQLALEDGTTEYTQVASDVPPVAWSTGQGAQGGPGALQETHELRYAGVRLGRLRLAWRPDADLHARDRAQDLVRRLTWLLQRRAFQSLNVDPASRSSLWVGASEEILTFTERLEVAARSHVPVHVHGEFGTDVSAAAWALHILRCGPDAPFIEVRGAHLQGEPVTWFEGARGGTLFFNGLQDLPARVMAELPQWLPSRLGQWTTASAAGACHVVSASTITPEALVDSLGGPRGLVAELSLVRLQVPPLRARRDDLPALLRHQCRLIGRDIELTCEDRAWVQLLRHDWPENHLELARLVGQLALNVQGRPVQYRDLMQCAPALAPDRRLGPRSEPDLSPEQPAAPRAKADAAVEWAGRLLRLAQGQDLEGESGLPRALVRALRCITAHYAGDLTQTEVASAACASASHLTSLFRQHLGVNFKTLVLQMRVLQAQRVLSAAAPVRVSELALHLGFSDLSHFERNFKRLSGCTPREYRLRHAA